MQGLAPGILTSGGRQYATWSPTNKASSIVLPAGFGNLKFETITPAVLGGTCISSIGMSTGKWYWEITVNTASSLGNTMVGIADSFKTSGVSNVLGGYTNSIAYRQNNGSLTYCFLRNNAPAGTGCSTDIAAGNVIGCALDMNLRTFMFFIEGVQTGPTQSLPAGGTVYYAACGSNGVAGNGGTANFGASTFVYYTASGAEAAGYNPGIYI